MEQELEEKKVEKRFSNIVNVSGYLRENNLELVKDKEGNPVISGSFTIAVTEDESHKMRVYLKQPADMKVEKDAKRWDAMKALLPTNTISIASYLKSNPTADFAVASSMSTKVWAVGSMEEYVRKENGKELSTTTLRVIRAGVRTASDKPFNPGASFQVDVYIESMNPEIVDEQETGRVILVGLVPLYKYFGKFTFVAPAENNVAQYILDHYNVTDTTRLFGKLSCVKHSKAKAETGNYFGQVSTPQYETTFVREKIITGGSAESINCDEPNAITKDEVREGLTGREARMLEADKKSTSKPANTGFSAAAKPASVTPAASKPSEGFDPMNWDGLGDMF